MRRSEVVFLGLGAACAAAIAMSAASCQSDDSSSSSAGPGGTGTGTGGNAASTSSGGGSGTTSSGTAGGGGAGGGAPAMAATIEDITKGMVADGTKVELKGVVAMSPKFFVSKGSSGSCLWGVFLSSPGDGETAAYSGILALSYGTDAMTGDGGTASCPKLGQAPAGDAFPDDVKPGDVLDVVGETSYFLLSQCATAPADTNPSKVKQRQLGKVSKVVKTGEAKPRTPHSLTADEVASLASPTDSASHDKWGGVKVRIGNVSPDTTGGTPIVDAHGNIKLQGSGLLVSDKIYYRGKMSSCDSEPVFTSSSVVWSRIDGFSSIDYCTWKLMPTGKCSDFEPKSEDCGTLMCP